jgi:hypothetical protein
MQKQIPPLRCGMTNKRTGNCKKQKKLQKQISFRDDKQNAKRQPLAASLRFGYE